MLDSDGQWELSGVEFGVEKTIDHESNLAPSGRDIRNQDGSNPIGDGVTFGRDRLDPTSWSFALFTNCANDREALAALDELEGVWRADDVRTRPGAVAELRYRMGGRIRRCYGRPRRFDAPPDSRMFSGYIPITCDFKLVDALYYDDEEESLTFTSMPAASLPGFLAPFAFPLSTAVLTETPGRQIDVGGTRKAPLEVDFTGPWINPTLRIAWTDVDDVLHEMKAPIIGTIPAGVTVTIDSRPWKNELRRSTADVRLSREVRMANLRLLPGSYSVSVSSSNLGDSGTAKVRWRKTYGSL